MSAKSKLSITPAAGYILLLPEEKETKTASGILLPDTASEKPQSGQVVAVGLPEVTSDGKKESPAKAGDRVIYKKWGGNEIKIEGKEYMFVKFEDILGVYIKGGVSNF